MQMNQAQQQAVLHKDGPMLVLAGPGSGKTLVITERTKHLIKEHHIPEDRILVITFTKAAAGEMKERFLKSMKVSRTGVSFGTFHAVFFTILKNAYNLNASNIIRDDTRFQLLKEIIHHMELEYEDEKEFIGDLFSEISLVKGNQIELANYYSTNCADEVFRSIYTEYNQRLRRASLIDFDDMLLLSYQLLDQRKDILSLWQKKFRYILIDEFQDINKVQYDIIRLLALPENNLFIVGDDDQSIYRFRGAKPEIMLQFPQDFPECKKISLNKNYRSTDNIVGAAGRLIKNNEKRFEKEVTAAKGEDRDIEIHHFATLAEQNQMLADEIIKLSKSGITLSEMAILIRTNMGSGAMIHKLMEYNIPFQMRDSLPNLFDHWITHDILAYIKIALGSTDRGLYLQIINRPKRYISRECFETPEVDYEAVKDYYEDKNWMLERLDQLEYDLAALSRMNPYAALNYIRRGVGYEEFLKEYANQRKIKTEELLDVLDELQESTRDYKTYEEWFAYMENYREELKRQAIESRNSKTDSIMIATMHSSKGLEFKVVFIVDANEGITPHKKAVLAEDIEEERRLFYVAMTRAKEYLYILCAKERYNKTMQISRFINEINPPPKDQK
ncbi:MAG TPA: ATP-dependent helicase [Mobilitalea sp.]|nr:ATP-dependent helicase [Mobilitalea sp.]